MSAEGRWRGVAPLGLAALCFTGLVFLRPRLQERQETAGLVIEAADTRGLSADVAVPTLALGAFRGLVVDYLWIRVIGLREQGRTYEARTLAEQICRLQPRLPAVWSYLASHLSYDLTASEDSRERRWVWIRNGIQLLRDQGLRYNPDSAELYYTLSRIYQDKINATFDEFHQFFKLYYVSTARRTGVHRFSVEELASAPPLEVLRAQDPAVERLWQRLEKHVNKTLIAQEILLGTFEQERIVEAERAKGKEPPRQVLRWLEWIEQPEGQRLLKACAVLSIKSELGMNPEDMRRVDQEWGPLDWQSSFSAAVYWAALGVEAAQRTKDIAQETRCRRAATLALKSAMRRGRVRWVMGRPITLPNLELIPRLDRIYREAIVDAEAKLDTLKRQDDFDPQDFRAASAFKTNQTEARKDFLVEAVILLSEYGRDTEGALLLGEARAAYPDEPSLQVPYDEFLLQTVLEKVTDAGAMDTQDSTVQGLLGLWQRAFQWLGLGEEARFKTYERLALARQQRWSAYIRAASEEDPTAAQRLGVPYRQVQRRALARAARALPRGFAARLAQRVGIPLGDLLAEEPGRQPGPGQPGPGRPGGGPR